MSSRFGFRWERFRSVLTARNKEFLRDRGALSWNFIFPILVVAGFAFAFSSDQQEVFKVAVVGPQGGSSAAAETSREFRALKYVNWVELSPTEEASALQRLRRHQFDLVLGNGRYWINDSSPKGYLLEKLLLGTQVKIERGLVSGREIRYVDWLISGLLAMNMMFSALFGVGYVIVRYRKSGVLRRLKATPISPFEFLLAQVVSRMGLLLAVTVLVFAGCHVFVRFQMHGSYLDLFAVMSLGALCLVSLGLVVAARIKSEEFAGGLLNLLTWPMMFLSGVWFSLEGAPGWVRGVAKVFPLTHVIHAARSIMTEGATLSQLVPELGMLGGMTALFLVLGAMIFKWE